MAAMIVSGKEMRVPPRPGASPKYVQVTPLRGLAPMPEWRHIDEVEPLQEAGPRLFKLYEERKDVPLLRVLVQAVASGTGQPEDVWSQMAPNTSLAHRGEVDTKVRYFGVKSTNVPPGADGHQTC